MGVSGAEAVVAAASPWVGLGESACLVRPYVDCACTIDLTYQYFLTDSHYSNDSFRAP
jgi:hypothetical protein